MVGEGFVEFFMNRKRRLFYLTLIVFLLYALLTGAFPMSTYTSSYEGASARFVGVVTGNGTLYTNAQKWDASACYFDTSINYDPDDAMKRYPNVVGEMSSVFVPVQQAIPPDYVPSEWWRGSVGLRNPTNSWSWEVRNEDGSWTKYTMEEWTTKWYLSVEAKFDSGPNVWIFDDEAQDEPRHKDLQVWVEFVVNEVWHFEGVERPLFAIGKIELEHVKISAKDNNGNEVDARVGLDFYPESPGSVLTIYHDAFGGGYHYNDESDIVTYAYREMRLNPQYFREKVYTHVDLNNFGTQEWGNAVTGLHAKGDVITLGFTVKQFVVGTWVVKDESTLQDYEGRNAQNVETWGVGTPIVDAFAWARSPWGTFTLSTVGFLFLALLVFWATFRFRRMREAVWGPKEER